MGTTRQKVMAAPSFLSVREKEFNIWGRIIGIGLAGGRTLWSVHKFGEIAFL